MNTSQTTHTRRFLLPSFSPEQVISHARCILISHAEVVSGHLPGTAFWIDGIPTLFFGEGETRQSRPLSPAQFFDLLTTAKHVVSKRRYSIPSSLPSHVDVYEALLEGIIIFTVSFANISELEAISYQLPNFARDCAVEITGNRAFDGDRMSKIPAEALAARRNISDGMFSSCATT